MMTHVFRGKTLLDAKRTAYRELGEDAVIVTTRHIAKDGLAGLLGGAEFEVSAMTAASEAKASPRSTYPNALKTVTPPGPFNAAVYKAEAPPKNEQLDELVGLRAQVRSELRAMKGTLAKSTNNEELLAEVSALRSMVEDLHAVAPKYSNAIRATGIEGGPALRALAHASKRSEGTSTAPHLRLRAALAEILATSAWPLATNEPTMIALVGPSGVGKTTTAAKLAAQAKMKGRSVLLVAADSFRVGAVEQLYRFAELLDTELEVANDCDELDHILNVAAADVVIVDTAGRGAPANGAVEHRLAMEVQGRARHVLLCLSASTRAADADRMARQFSTARPTGLVITKIDETSTPAGIVHASISSKLPVSTMCFGQRVPEDIAPATVPALVDYLIGQCLDRGSK
jgi:flagellar biosynthesis protein FlhF